MNSPNLDSVSTTSLNRKGSTEVKLRNGRRNQATLNRRSDVFSLFRYSSMRLRVDLRKRRARSEYIPPAKPPFPHATRQCRGVVRFFGGRESILNHWTARRRSVSWTGASRSCPKPRPNEPVVVGGRCGLVELNSPAL
ncbi:hypothetical protein PoB_004207500 [Plakobranchus ocellatus]|uniref:Uncharacterized protein n=1 Tax=Plakobranchus ocellatus TaxID=259542 RepID=A0AAV4B8Z2_9GAST|nr:hypothetical protein PoB_004207500 [Plakobranchus ocellatus]